MSANAKITFYDIPSKLTPQAWSSNTWKVRLVLNYKRIPYNTVWVSYPDIESTIKSLGGKPTDISPDGKPLYTLPAIVDSTSGSPVLVTNSLVIIEYLEEKYPEPPVLPERGKALEYAFEEAARSMFLPHIPKLLFPPMWKILDDRSQPYFRETRERWLGNGKPLEEWSPEGPAHEADWEAFKKSMDKLAALLDKNGPGADYVAGGDHPTRADFLIVAFLALVVAVAPGDWERRIKTWNDGRWARLWELSEEWRAVP